MQPSLRRVAGVLRRGSGSRTGRDARRRPTGGRGSLRTGDSGLRTEEAGFSVVEVIAALGAVSVVIMILTVALASALNSALHTKVLQQATALGDEAVERSRALDYRMLAMRSTDLSGDPAVSGAGTTNPTFDPDGDGPLQPEPLVLDDTNGQIYPHTEERTVGAPHLANETVFTLSRYVTWVDANVQGGAQRDHKRVVAIVTWPSDGEILSYSASTFIADVGRGRAVTKFELDPIEQETMATADSPDVQRVAFTHDLKNLDVSETYDLTLDGLPSGWTFFGFFADNPDSGAVGDYDAADTKLFDTNGNATEDTAALGIGEGITFHVVFEVPENQPAQTVELTVTADPANDASAASGQAVDRLILEGASS